MPDDSEDNKSEQLESTTNSDIEQEKGTLIMKCNTIIVRIINLIY